MLNFDISVVVFTYVALVISLDARQYKHQSCVNITVCPDYLVAHLCSCFYITKNSTTETFMHVLCTASLCPFLSATWSFLETQNTQRVPGWGGIRSRFVLACAEAAPILSCSCWRSNLLSSACTGVVPLAISSVLVPVRLLVPDRLSLSVSPFYRRVPSVACTAAPCRALRMFDSPTHFAQRITNSLRPIPITSNITRTAQG